MPNIFYNLIKDLDGKPLEKLENKDIIEGILSQRNGCLSKGPRNFYNYPKPIEGLKLL